VTARRALFFHAALLCACGDSTGETGIDLTIRYDAALGLDRLALSARAGGETIAERTLLPEEQRPLSDSGRESALVLLPDQLGGQEVTVQVDGLVRGSTAASGQVVVTAERGALLSATVTLRPGGDRTCEPWDWEPAEFVPCDDAAPDGELRLDGDGTYTVDTATGLIATPDGGSLAPASDLVAQADGPSIRVVAVDALVIGEAAVLEASGPRPLLFAVWGDASIDGTIDLSGAAGRDGPGGGDPDLCAQGGGGDGTASDSDDSGAGGGGGGAYGDDGGDGGDGQGDAKGAKGTRGREVGSPGLSPLVGGCGGGRGGDASGAADSGGPGGGGGGAIAIAARDSIALSGTIRVAGGGGHGGDPAATSGAGGGGGGAGGAIFLQSIEIELSAGARLCANGGSGGEGAVAEEAGAGGSAGTCDEERAATLNQVAGGGDGGRGGAGDMGTGESGKGGAEGGAGGGGGGSAGRIRVRASGQLTDLGALFTPAAE